MNPKRKKRKRHRAARREAERSFAAAESGDLNCAHKGIRRALKRAADSPRVWTELGRILALEGRLREAERALRKAILIGPRYVDAYVDLVDVLTHKGLTIEAYRTALQVVEMCPQVPLYRELLHACEARLPPDFGRRFEPSEAGDPQEQGG